VEALLGLGAVLEHPAGDGRMIDGDTPFVHELFELVIAQGILPIPPDACEDKLLLEMGTLETDDDLPLSPHHRGQRTIIPERACD
jgi:hypothetical protein